jgi:hypothetical protein
MHLPDTAFFNTPANISVDTGEVLHAHGILRQLNFHALGLQHLNILSHKGKAGAKANTPNFGVCGQALPCIATLRVGA